MQSSDSQTTLSNLPPQLLQMICFTMLEIEDMWSMMTLSKTQYNLLRLSKYSQQLFLNSLVSRLDLPVSLKATSSPQILEQKLQTLLELFCKLKSEVHRPRLARFFGFKTNMGMEMYPNPRYSFTNLFEPSGSPYCSDSMTGPALVQGVYIPEDTGKYWEDDPTLRELIDGKIKIYKSDENYNFDKHYSMTSDERRARILVGGAMFLTRCIPEGEITAQSLQRFPMYQIARYFEISTKKAKRDFPNASMEELRSEIAKNLEVIRSKGLQYLAQTSVDFMSERDQESMEKIKQTWPKYIEIKHKEHVERVKNDFLMISKVKVSVEGQLTCPVRTIALFAHNDEFQYDQMPPIVKRVSEECKSLKDLQKLIDEGLLPSMITGYGVKVDNKRTSGFQTTNRGLIGSDIILFDPRNKEINSKNDGIRLVAWICNFSDHAPLDDIEVFLPKQITTKFVTAALIESENLIPLRLREHYPEPNVDCTQILFSGNRLQIPEELFE